MIVYLLVVIATKTSFFSNTVDVQVATMVFADKTKCYANAKYNEDLLLKSFDEVKSSCQEKKIEQ